MISNDSIYKGHVITIYPDEEQKRYIEKCINLHRFVYNWTIDQKENQLFLYENGQTKTSLLKTSEISKRLSEFRNSHEWMKAVPLHTLRNAMYDAIDAYDRFFNRKGYNKPKYKSKKKSKKSFAPATDRDMVYFVDDTVHIEGLKTGINIKLNTGLKRNKRIKIANARISIDNTGRYKLSYITFEKKPDQLQWTSDNEKAIGIDLNVHNLIVTSYKGGEIYKAPDIKSEERAIKRLQRKCRKDFERCNSEERTNPEIAELSNNAKKRRIKLAKKYKKITNIFDTTVRTIAKKIITRNPKAIVMEDLDVTAMKQKRYISKTMGSHIAFYKIRQIFQWNCEKYNVPFILAPRDFKSTETCSVCGAIKTNLGSYRTYNCDCCGARLDRDINASINLEKLAYT